MSVGQVGCRESDIQIEDVEPGLGSTTWTAICHGQRFFCSQVNTGGGSTGNHGYINTSQVNCSAERGSAGSASARGDAHSKAANDGAGSSTSKADSGSPESKRASSGKSAAPAGAAGFTFGSTLDEAGSACSQAGKEWKREEGFCSGTPTDIGIPASARVRTCEGKVCVIEVTPTVKNGLGQAFLATKDALTKKYGAPESGSNNVLPSSCADGLASCLESGRAKLEFSWRFPDRETIILSIAKVDKADETPTMRLRYAIPANTVRVNAQGL